MNDLFIHCHLKRKKMAVLSLQFLAFFTILLHLSFYHEVEQTKPCAK